MKKILLVLLILFSTLLSCNKEEDIISIPPTPNFTVTLNSDEGGSLSSNGGTYILGSKLLVTVVPDRHYLFNKWSDGSTDNPREIIVNKDIELNVSFNKKSYPLSLDINGEGVVDESVIINSSRTESIHKAETVVRLTANPNTGWVFSKWVLDDKDYTDNPIDIKIEKGTDVIAYFTRETFELNLNIIGNGTIKEEVILTPSQYEYQTVTRLTAVPQEGWEFVSWEGDINSSDNPIEFEINKDISINALFTEVDTNEPILVTKNSIYLDYSDWRRHTFYTATSRQHFNIGGNEYFLIASDGSESFLFKRIDTTWELVHIENQTEIHGSGGSFETYDVNKFVIAGTGEHFWTDPSTWKDYIYRGKIENDRVVYEKIVDIPAYWRHPGFGNVDGSGTKSVVNGAWFFTDEGTTPFKANFVGDVKPHGNVEPLLEQYYDPNFNLINSEELKRVKGNVLTTRVFDIFEGGRDEIIHCYIDTSDRVTDEDDRAPRGEIFIYEFSDETNRYEIVSEIPKKGQLETVELVKTFDVNNDGFKDILLEIATGNPSLPQPFEIWINNGDKTFSLHDRFNISDGGFGTLGWELLDINNDSFLDLIFQPYSGGDAFIQNWCTSDCSERQQQGLPVKDGLKLHNAIYINNGNGTFNKFQQEILVQDTYVEWLKAFMRNGNLCFFGSVYKPTDGGTMEIELVDIELKNYF